MNLNEFVNLSAALTGYPASTLQPSFDTQYIAEQLYTELSEPENNIPLDQITLLTDTWRAISASSAPNPPSEALVKEKIINNLAITRLAQNIIYLWYFGIWYDLAKNPAAFTKTNTDHVVSPSTYINGLVWGEMGAHPMGYSIGDFGYWADTPTLPAIN